MAAPGRRHDGGERRETVSERRPGATKKRGTAAWGRAGVRPAPTPGVAARPLTQRREKQMLASCTSRVGAGHGPLSPVWSPAEADMSDLATSLMDRVRTKN